MPSFDGVGDWLGQPVSGFDWLRQPVTGPGWLRILARLVVSPMTPTELANVEKKHLSEVSRTLRTMRDSGLVEYVNTGSRERYYRATEEGYLLFRQSLR
jgi:DNA-binding PadR family transcriptional regulator